MTERILTPRLTDKWVAAQDGKLLDLRYARTIVGAAGGDVDFLRPEGTILFAFRPLALPEWACGRALPAARKVAKWSEHRQAHSNLAGSFDLPKPRVTRFTRENPEDWLKLLPLLGFMDAVYRKACPSRYEAQAQAAARVHPYYRIHGTVSTTLTANLDWRSPCHRDDGNTPGSLSVLTVLGGGFEGGELILPKWNVAIDVREGDVLIADLVREYHGNAPLRGGRVSLVLYPRDGLRGVAPPRSRGVVTADGRPLAVPDTWVRTCVILDLLGAGNFPPGSGLATGEAKKFAGHRRDADWRPLEQAGLIALTTRGTKRIDGPYWRIILVRLTDKGLRLARSVSPEFRESALTDYKARRRALLGPTA